MASAAEPSGLVAIVSVSTAARVLLCRICRSAVCLGSGTEAHFRRHKITGDVLQAVLSVASSTSLLHDPRSVVLPPDGSLAIEGLPVFSGFSCQACRYLTCNKTKMYAHVGMHKERSGRGWVKVGLQAFVRGNLARYWIVETEAVEGASTTDDSSGGVGGSTVGGDSSFVSAVRTCERELTDGDRKRQQMVEAPGGVDREDPWVSWIKWAKHLQGKDRSVLHAAGCLPLARGAESKLRSTEAIEANRRLRQLADSFDRELTRSMLRLDSVPLDTLKWLNSVDPSKPSGQPFQLKQNAGSMEWYSTCWQRYLCYCTRIYMLGREGAEEQHGARFTDEQWARLDDAVAALDAAVGSEPAGDEEDDPLSAALDRAVFLFCIASIKQRLSGDVYKSPLLHFTSVLGIKPRSRTWMAAHSFTRFLAGFLWAGRVLMLEHVFGDEPAGADAEASFEQIDDFQAQYRAWLSQGSYNPVSTLIGWMAYGKGYRNRETGVPRLMWDSDGKTLSLLGERFRVADFQKMAQAVAREAEDALDAVTFGRWAALSGTIDLGRIVDTLIKEGAGRSFATNERNTWLGAGAEQLARLSGPSLLQKQHGQEEPAIRQRAAVRYIQQLRRLRAALIACVHIWGGQPGRGPEMATLKHCDTEQLPRNVFVFDGLVLIVTDRDKNKSIRGIGRKVARFLPEQVSRMMVAYIAWVLPFERVVHEMTGMRGPAAEDWPWLWKDGRKGVWRTEHLSEQLDVWSSAVFGVRLTVMSYRHVAVELGRRIKALSIRQEEINALDGDGDDDSDLIDPYTGELREQARVEYIWDLQSTHGSRIARNHYALHVMYPNELQPEMILSYQVISRLWHGFLARTDGEFTQKRTVGDAALAPPLDRQEKRIRRSSEVKQGSRAAIEVDAGLARLFGPTARWYSKAQRDGMVRIAALRATGARSEVLIVVLPTGGGKSVFFMLPAAMEQDGSVSVVVVPFVALADDLVGRAQDAGIDCMRWKPGHEAGREGRARDVRLVVVSADVALCDEFLGYLESFRSRGLLRRIFFDECHTVIVDAGYRAHLHMLAGLHRFGCPMIMLTATLPVAMEGWFRQVMQAGEAAVLRTAAVKANIRYGVETVKAGKSEVEDRTVEVMQRLGGRMRGGEKGVVYCRSYRECGSLAERTGCGEYHRGRSDDERQEALQGWTEGRAGGRWIAATSALGTGVDIRGITAVVHMRVPYGLVDFTQQTGRGGRQAGEVVESIIVTDGRAIEFPDDLFDDDVTQLNRKAMGEFVGTAGCRRQVLGRFLDGAGLCCRDGGPTGMLACDRCVAECEGSSGEDEAAAAAGESRWAEGTRAGSQQVKKLKRWLAEASTVGCAVCYVYWHLAGRDPARAGEHSHERSSCTWMTQQSFERWRQPLRFARYRCCVECGLPFDWCQEARTEERCRYRNVVLPVVLLAARCPDLQTEVEARFGVRVKERGFAGEAFKAWLMRSKVIHGVDMTNALAIWDWIVQEIC
jgi:superfamily II DNA helicase RecQ